MLILPLPPFFIEIEIEIEIEIGIGIAIEAPKSGFPHPRPNSNQPQFIPVLFPAFSSQSRYRNTGPYPPDAVSPICRSNSTIRFSHEYRFTISAARLCRIVSKERGADRMSTSLSTSCSWER